MIAIHRVQTWDPSLCTQLGELLQNTVHDGASVGFLAPLSEERAAVYWQGVFQTLGSDLILWYAVEETTVVGSVQLSLCGKENGRHRGEIQKLLVLSSYRRQGIASRLMETAETYARDQGRTLLILDTLAGSLAEHFYQHWGWQKAGEIPNYAADPQGQLHPTAYYYKQLIPTDAVKS